MIIQDTFRRFAYRTFFLIVQVLSLNVNEKKIGHIQSMNSDEKAPKIVVCPHCNSRVPQTEYCITCGEKMTKPLEKSQEQLLPTRICHHCGHNVPQTAFCIHCGKSLAQESVVSEESQQCPLCRENIPRGHPFCHLCGAKIQTQVEDGLQTVICNNCWKTNPPNTGYCVHCGTTNLGKKTKEQSLFLEQPFEGFQVDISELHKPSTVPIKLFSHTSVKSFPVKSTILHSREFGVHLKTSQTLSFLNKNFGGFNRENIVNYLGSFVIVSMIYFFWFQSTYSSIVENPNPIFDGVVTIIAGILLTALLMMPLWLATFLVHRKTGYRVNYRLDTSRVLITMMFNLLWGYFGGGPIILRLGDIRNTEERAIKNFSFIKGVGWGSLFTVISTAIIAILTASVVGIPGSFAGFLFQNNMLQPHIYTLFFGACWISLILILPLGDYYDRVLKEWNIVTYLMMLITAILILLYSYQVLAVISFGLR